MRQEKYSPDRLIMKAKIAVRTTVSRTKRNLREWFDYCSADLFRRTINKVRIQ